MRHSIKSETSILIGFVVSLKEKSIANSRSNFQFLKANQVRIFNITFDTGRVHFTAGFSAKFGCFQLVFFNVFRRRKKRRSQVDEDL